MKTEELELIAGNAKTSAYSDVLELLESEISKAKDRGDLASAETIEMLRAKVKAKFLGSVT